MPEVSWMCPPRQEHHLAGWEAIHPQGPPAPLSTFTCALEGGAG